MKTFSPFFFAFVVFAALSCTPEFHIEESSVLHKLNEKLVKRMIAEYHDDFYRYRDDFYSYDTPAKYKYYNLVLALQMLSQQSEYFEQLSYRLLPGGKVDSTESSIFAEEKIKLLERKMTVSTDSIFHYVIGDIELNHDKYGIDTSYLNKLLLPEVLNYRSISSIVIGRDLSEDDLSIAELTGVLLHNLTVIQQRRRITYELLVPILGRLDDHDHYHPVVQSDRYVVPLGASANIAVSIGSYSASIESERVTMIVGTDTIVSKENNGVYEHVIEGGKRGENVIPIRFLIEHPNGEMIAGESEYVYWVH